MSDRANIVAAAMAVGFAIRASMVDKFSVWLDEAWSIDFVANRSPLAILVDSFRVDFHPFVYYEILKLWGYVAGYSGEVSRWPSVAIGTAAIFTTYMMVKALADEKTAAVAAWLMAFSPVAIRCSAESRMYVVVLAVLPLMVWALVSGRKKSAVASFAVLAYSHAMAGVLALPVFATFAWPWRRGIVVSAVILTPWLVRMAALSGNQKALAYASLERAAELPHWLLFASRPWWMP